MSMEATNETGKNPAGVQSPLERKVIRQILEGEIISHCKSAERHAAINAFDAAAKDDAIRQGISHALFVLAVKCGV